MNKSIAFIPRRTDLSRAEFGNYYETQHAPLGCQHFPFAKYVRNHLAGDEEPGFDAMVEFFTEDPGRSAEIDAGEGGKIMRVDEAKFMIKEDLQACGSQESLVAGAPRVVENGPRPKIALLLKADKELMPEQLAPIASTWASHFTDRCERITLDVLKPWPGATLPCDAILWFWPSDHGFAPDTGLPSGLKRVHQFAITSCETPPSSLLGHNNKI